MRNFLAVCLVFVVALSLGVQTGQSQPRVLRVSIVGDSFSETSAANGGYAHLAGTRGCWNLNLVARAGSGYLASEDPYVSRSRITAVASSVPDVIVIQGSGNDRADERLFPAAASLYATYRVLAPQARIVVVGPTGAPNAKHANIDGIRRTLRDAATLTGVTFLDPKAEGWLDAGTDYSPDGIHPNTRGHARMATRLFDAMAALGIQRVDSCR